MRGFWVGLVVGAIAGGAGAVIWYERPWDKEPVALTTDAGPEADAGATGKRNRRKRRRRRQPQNDGPVVVSAADRQMRWRGPSVELSPRSLDFGEDGEARSLNSGEINAGIGPVRKRLSSCLADARGEAEIAADITFKFLVNGQGNATRSRVRAPVYLLKNGLHACLDAAARRMQFAATGGETLVTLPLELR